MEDDLLPPPACRQRTGPESGRTRSKRLDRNSSDAPTSSSLGTFPDSASVIRLVGALLVDINDEMIAAERRDVAAASVVDLTDEPNLPFPQHP